MEQIRVNKLSQYIDEIEQLEKKIYNKNDNKKPLTFFFRGQGNDHKPLPSVYRDTLIEKEDYLYHELILRCPSIFHGMGHLDTLVMMQHYNLPTRLLDVTSNPLVALFFACIHYNNGNPLGRVYVYGVSEENLAYSDSDKALMLSCLPVLSVHDRRAILKEINSGNEEFNKTKQGIYFAHTERLYHEVAKEVPAFKREIKPIDLVKPLFLKPLRANERILRQDGAFIISGLCADAEDGQKKIEPFCNAMVEIKDRKELLKELDSFGVNAASLFPEIDKVADFLKNQCIGK
nr:FRG domain-containing protein [Clostridia bacterium]